MSVLELRVASGEPLSVRSFTVREAVSEPFDVSVVARSEDPSVDLDAIVGQPATFRIVSGVAGAHHPERRWTGICRFAEQEQAEPFGLSTYRFVIAPELWRLTQRRGHRIVQHQAAPSVAAGVLDAWGIERDLHLDAAAHPPLPYVVQYAESDYAFFCRVLEEAGIAFTFPEGDRGHGVLTLGDRLHEGAPRPAPIVHVPSPNRGDDQELVTDVRLLHQSRPGAYTLADHDLRRPRQRLSVEATKAQGPAAAHEQYHYRPGAFLVDTDATDDTPMADAEATTRHEPGAGRRRAERALASERADRRVVSYRTNALDLWPGRVFSIAGHPHPDLADGASRLLVTESLLEGAVDEVWALRGRAVFADSPYRPPLRTARSRARVQSATVVGGEDIHPDELGRVRVQFPWDRDGSSTCWVRVSQAWAGAAYGMVTLPREGQEVFVDFLEGDPEQPVIVGRLFNQTNPVIERLPEHDTRSAWKSDSSPGSSGFNEILFEDRKGSELVHAQAQQDARRLVKQNDTSTVVHDRRKLVEDNELETTGANRVQETQRDRVELTYQDRTTAIDGTRRDRVNRDALERLEGDQVVRVGEDRHTLTTGLRRELVEHDAHLQIGGRRPESVGGTDSLTVGKSLQESVGSYSVDASGPEGWIHMIAWKTEIVIESATEVTVKGAGGFVKVDGGGVTIVGAEVVINEGGSPGSLPGPGPHLPVPPRIVVVDEPAPPSSPIVS